MGRPKPLIEHDGCTLLERTIRAAHEGGCEPIIVVVGSDSERLDPVLAGLPVDVVDNPRWAAGMSTSISCGVAALQDRPEVLAAVLLTIDQPAIDDAVVRAILSAFDGRSGHRVASSYAGTLGVPALFERSLFPRLRQLKGDRGAKELLTVEGEPVTPVDWPAGSHDLDRPQDLSGPA